MSARPGPLRSQEALVSSIETSIEPLEREWEELAERTGASPFLRPAWMRLWWQAFGAGKLEIIVVRRAGGLVGVASLERKWGALQGLANWHTPEFGILAEDSVVTRALAQVFIAHAGWRGTLSFVDSTQPELRELRLAADQRGYSSFQRTLERSPYLEIEGDWDSYWRSRSRNLRRGLERQLRRLDEEGVLSVEVYDGRDRLDERLAECFQVEAAGWKAARRTAISSRAETHRFYRDVARWAADRGWLRLIFIRLDGRALAGQIALEHDGILYTLKGGYDPAYARFSPGNLLLRATLEHAFSAGLSRCELLGDAEQYKLAWTRNCRNMIALHVLGPSVLGWLAWSTLTYGRPLAKRANLDSVVNRFRR